MERRKVKNGEKSSSRRSLLFFVPHFSALFRLSLVPTICPWVSEDDLVGRDEKRAPLKTSAWEATTTAAATRTAKKQ